MSGRFRKMASVVAVALVFGFLPTGTLAGPVMIWSEGFETGLGEWTSSSGNFSAITSSLAFDGARYLNVVGPSAPGGDTLSVRVSSEGYEELLFEGYRKVYTGGIEGTDRLSIQWAVDGLNWQTPVTFSDLPADDWSLFSFSLPEEANDNPNLAFRWLAEFDTASDRMLVDGLSLTGVPEPATLGLLSLGAFAGVCRRRFW